ncbi:MAG: hydantoinase/oxoprolinase family protein [Eubacteriales bacterium]|nr:hydantoinase/oxoprolinase family protein [Eubacteriales bacterium]
MSFILGIDTGGTYTDGVVVDTVQKKVLVKAKAFTTKYDLTAGIGNCIDGIDSGYLKKTKLICLSTTLATNAIVEGKGGKIGLLVTGGNIEDKLPACFWRKLRGKLDIKGKVKEELDEKEVSESIEYLIKQKIDALAISGFASVRNPVHELKIKEIARQKTQIPVVCAHELSLALGFHERTVTAVLDARLIPVISELIMATGKVLETKGIKAQIMVVKGDGSLMNGDSALNKPIETIISGPAASIIGCMFLTGKKDAMIVDMGGTTTDIANLHKGAVKIRKNGAKVGGWSTQIRAAEVCTFGIGGDSYIQVDSKGGITVGPKRVRPLCVAGEEYPNLLNELTSIRKDPSYEMFSEQEVDCFSYIRCPDRSALTGQDKKIVELLDDGPHSALYLAAKLKKDVESLNLSCLVDSGLLERISFTPTDVLHAMDKFNEWDEMIAKAAAKILAFKTAVNVDDFIQNVYGRIIEELTLSCIQSIADFEKQEFDIRKDTTARYFFEKAFDSRKQELMKSVFHLKKPVVAVGAPAHAWMKPVCDNLNAHLVVPEHAEVANAVGAAAGKVIETAEALIRPDNKGREEYILHLPDGSRTFDELQQAKDYALPYIRKYVEFLVRKEGGGDISTFDNVEDIYVKGTRTGKGVYVETRISMTAVGDPLWKK